MPENKQTPLQQLAALLGSKNTHPIPPDQYTTYQDKRYSPAIRLWSLLVQCSIAPKHQQGPATYHGQPLTLAVISHILRMDPGTTRLAWRQLERENRVRKEKDGTLWISGDFKLGEEEANKKGCTTFFPQYYQKQINKLEKSLREKFIAEELADRERRALITADLIAASRFIFDQRQNSRFQAYGVKIIREQQKAKRGKEQEKAARDSRVLTILPELEKVVQPFLDEKVVQRPDSLVQPFAAEGSPQPEQQKTKPDTGKDRGVLPRYIEKKSVAAARSSYTEATAPPPPNLIEWMREALEKYPGADKLAGSPDNLICKDCLTAGTPDEIMAGLREMDRAHKFPSVNWRWFTPEIIRQHIPRRKSA